MTDSDALILAGLLAFGLAALSAILWGACVYWRGELRDYKAACWRLAAFVQFFCPPFLSQRRPHLSAATHGHLVQAPQAHHLIGQHNLAAVRVVQVGAPRAVALNDHQGVVHALAGHVMRVGA